MSKINIGSSSVTIEDGSVTTDGWKSNEKSEKQDWGFLDADQQEAIEEDLTNARVDGMESTLLAFTKAGVIDRNDARLQAALTEVFDALINQS